MSHPSSHELLGRYAGVPVCLEARLDHRRFSIRDLMALRPGAVLRLHRAVGEPLELRVGGTLLGFGEVVAGERSAGVRITSWER
ncbi:MAG: FliM/FliN family flagellar motor switch protein [Acidobacteria bacterium]|nr:FliM/FliN family flagellar motor switch protein [Acidobacteriota bacterium]